MKHSSQNEFHSNEKPIIPSTVRTPRVNSFRGFIPEAPYERQLDRNLGDCEDKSERFLSIAKTPEKIRDKGSYRFNNTTVSATPKHRYLILLKRQELADRWRESEQKRKEEQV